VLLTTAVTSSIARGRPVASVTLTRSIRLSF